MDATRLSPLAGLANILSAVRPIGHPKITSISGGKVSRDCVLSELEKLGKIQFDGDQTVE
jgi:hypothetical protein